MSDHFRQLRLEQSCVLTITVPKFIYISSGLKPVFYGDFSVIRHFFIKMTEKTEVNSVIMPFSVIKNMSYN